MLTDEEFHRRMRADAASELARVRTLVLVSPPELLEWLDERSRRPGEPHPAIRRLPGNDPGTSLALIAHMPAKAKVPDFIGRFYAEQRRDAAARRGIALADAGKKKEARAAEREANEWDREVKRLG